MFANHQQQLGRWFTGKFFNSPKKANMTKSPVSCHQGVLHLISDKRSQLSHTRSQEAGQGSRVCIITVLHISEIKRGFVPVMALGNLQQLNSQASQAFRPEECFLIAQNCDERTDRKDGSVLPSQSSLS